MAHARTQIVDAIKALITGLSATGSNVVNGRPYPQGDDELPALGIRWVADEQSDLIEPTPTRELRELSIEIEARAKAVNSTTPIDDTLDAIALEVETAIIADSKLGGLLRDAVLLQESTKEEPGELEGAAGVLTMRYRALYRINPANPELIVT